MCCLGLGFVGWRAQRRGRVFRLMLEEPINGEIHGGVGNLRGWAVASEGIDKVEIFIDGEYAFDAPYGGSRGDVGAPFLRLPMPPSQDFHLLMPTACCRRAPILLRR